MREQYLNMRRTSQYDFGWFYRYYLENKDKSKLTPPFEIFQQAFNMYFNFNAAAIIEYLDKQMGVTKIENEQGQLIYIN